MALGAEDGTKLKRQRKTSTVKQPERDGVRRREVEKSPGIWLEWARGREQVWRQTEQQLGELEVVCWDAIHKF